MGGNSLLIILIDIFKETIQPKSSITISTMKKLSLLFLTAFIALTTAAQDERMGVFAISAGPSFSSGEYGETNPLSTTSGYASSGIALNFLFQYKFSEYIGLAGMSTGFTHSFDTDALKEQNAMLGTDVTIESDDWAGGAVLVGPLFSYPTGQFDFDVRVLFGYANVRRPKTVVSAMLGNNEAKSTIQYATGGGFALGLGAGARYNVSNGISFLSTLIICLPSLNLLLKQVRDLDLLLRPPKNKVFK